MLKKWARTRGFVSRGQERNKTDDKIVEVTALFARPVELAASAPHLHVDMWMPSSSSSAVWVRNV